MNLAAATLPATAALFFCIFQFASIVSAQVSEAIVEGPECLAQKPYCDDAGRFTVQPGNTEAIEELALDVLFKNTVIIPDSLSSGDLEYLVSDEFAYSLSEKYFTPHMEEALYGDHVYCDPDAGVFGGEDLDRLKDCVQSALATGFGASGRPILVEGLPKGPVFFTEGGTTCRDDIVLENLQVRQVTGKFGFDNNSEPFVLKQSYTPIFALLYQDSNAQKGLLLWNAAIASSINDNPIFQSATINILQNFGNKLAERYSPNYPNRLKRYSGQNRFLLARVASERATGTNSVLAGDTSDPLACTPTYYFISAKLFLVPVNANTNLASQFRLASDKVRDGLKDVPTFNIGALKGASKLGQGTAKAVNYVADVIDEIYGVGSELIEIPMAPRGPQPVSIPVLGARGDQSWDVTPFHEPDYHLWLTGSARSTHIEPGLFNIRQALELVWSVDTRILISRWTSEQF